MKRVYEIVTVHGYRKVLSESNVAEYKAIIENSIENKKPITKARKDENAKKELGGKDVSCFPPFVFS